MTTTILGSLTERGVAATEEEVARLFEAALEETGFHAPYPDPRVSFSEKEIALLERGGFDMRRLDPGIDDPIVRMAAEYSLLRASSLTTRAAAKRLRVNDSRVRQLLGAHRLYGIKVGDEWRLPAFQFTTKGQVPGIDQALARLPEGINPVSVQRFFASPNPDLEVEEGRAVSPIEWLLTGNDPERVAEIVAAL